MGSRHDSSPIACIAVTKVVGSDVVALGERLTQVVQRHRLPRSANAWWSAPRTRQPARSASACGSASRARTASIICWSVAERSGCGARGCSASRRASDRFRACPRRASPATARRHRLGPDRPAAALRPARSRAAATDARTVPGMPRSASNAASRTRRSLDASSETAISVSSAPAALRGHPESREAT